MYHICCSTYESASLRMYRLGRTDTIRSTSKDSLRFVQAMDDPSKSVSCAWCLCRDTNHQYSLYLYFDFLSHYLHRAQSTEKVEMLEKAVHAHRSYTDMVSFPQPCILTLSFM